MRGSLLGEDLEEEEEDDTIVDAPPPPPAPTVSAAMDALNLLRTFYQNNNLEGEITELLQVEKRVQEYSTKEYKQKSIKDFFK